MKAYQSSPCAECPWRMDVAPGRFPADRFRDLAVTAYDMAVDQFACHKSPQGREFGCAGFVLRGATHNLGARLAARAGRLDLREIASPFPLHESYRAMAIANGVDPDDPSLESCREPR
jgi:hypothetical protein